MYRSVIPQHPGQHGLGAHCSVVPIWVNSCYNLSPLLPLPGSRLSILGVLLPSGAFTGGSAPFAMSGFPSWSCELGTHCFISSVSECPCAPTPAWACFAACPESFGYEDMAQSHLNLEPHSLGGPRGGAGNQVSSVIPKVVLATVRWGNGPAQWRKKRLVWAESRVPPFSTGTQSLPVDTGPQCPQC